MCSDEHSVMYGSNSIGKICPSSFCSKTIVSNSKYWYRLVSEMLTAFCRELESFQIILDIFNHINKSINEGTGDRYYEFYDGELFKRFHKNRMINFKDEEEIVVFLKFSTDGFK